MSEHVAGTLVASLISWLIVGLFIHWAAKIVLDHSNYVQAFLTALVGSLLAGVILLGLGGGTVGIAAALGAWALVGAAFYRTTWAKGAVVGVVAWILWAVVDYLIGVVLG
ncbi:MAG: hypothetical protein ACPGQL_07510 [Thermoplasmatota archaeon]